MTNCPFHKKGQERTPSFGILKSDGTCHCFTCGWVGSTEEMIGEVLAYAGAAQSGRKWLLKKFNTFTLSQRQRLPIAQSRGDKRIQTQAPGFTAQELEKYRFYHPYMYKRGLNDEIIEMFDIGYDKDFEIKNNDKGEIHKLPSITFPVYTLDNTPAFIARRSVDTEFFHYPASSTKPVYAANKVYAENSKEVIIVEGVLDALTCWKYKKPAVALLGTGTAEQYSILKKLPARKYIIGTDPDKAGFRARDKLYNNLKDSKIVSFLDIPEGEDINALDSDFLNLREYL